MNPLSTSSGSSFTDRGQRAKLSLYMRRAKKELGQHFLEAPAVVEAIVGAGELTATDTVLEIGPGQGVLTESLLKTGARVIAVEKDSDLMPHLRERFASQIESNQLILKEADIRSFIYDELPAGYKLVANIPYYLTGLLFREIFDAAVLPSTVVLLVQKEVAERITREGRESILSLSIKAFGQPQYLQTVPSAFFNPPPKVDSAVLVINHISRSFFSENSFTEKEFFSLVKRGFASPRKTLINNLFPRDKALGEKILSRLGLQSTARAESLLLEDWRKLVTIMVDEALC